MLTTMTYFGFIPGYVLFWGVFAVALGLFSYRIRQLLQYMFLGQKETGYKSWGKWITNTFAYVFSQLCQLKNFRAKDRAPLGHALMAWGFFVFVLFYFFFFILAEGFGLTGLENTNFLFYFAWVMDFMAVFVIIGAGWGLIRRFIVRPDRLKGEQTIEALIILLSVFTHPFAYLFNQATVIAMGAPPAGLGHSLLPPVSAWLSHLFTGSTALAIQNWHVGFFWADWLTVLFVLVYIPYSRYLHVCDTAEVLVALVGPRHRDGEHGGAGRARVRCGPRCRRNDRAEWKSGALLITSSLALWRATLSDWYHPGSAAAGPARQVGHLYRSALRRRDEYVKPDVQGTLDVIEGQSVVLVGEPQPTAAIHRRGPEHVHSYNCEQAVPDAGDKNCQESLVLRSKNMIDIVNKRNWFFLVSLIILVPGIISMLVFGFRLGIDFSSGTTMTLRFSTPVDQSSLRQQMTNIGYEEASIQKTSSGDYLVRIKEINTDQKQALIAGLTKGLNTDVTVRDFYTVSPLVASEVARNAAIAVGIAAIFMIIYIAFAFRHMPNPFRWGLSAVIALLHDVLIVMGIFSILGWLIGYQVDSMFITAMLTIVGYCMNNTCVVYDRIRENVRKGISKDFAVTVNSSILETMTRSNNMVNHPPCTNLLRLATRNEPSMVR